MHLSSSDEIEHVVALERRLLAPDVRGSAGRLRELLHPDFVEFGASGRRWNRPSIIDALTTTPDHEPQIPVDDMRAVAVAGGVVLVTYRSRHGGRTCLRSSLWRRTGATWQLYFHQGTIVPDETSN